MLFVKIKVAFVAESYSTDNENIQTYFAALQLDARFNAATRKERMVAITGKETVEQKIRETVKHNCCRSIIIISWNYHLRWLLSN